MALAEEQHLEVDLGVPRFLRPCLRPPSPQVVKTMIQSQCTELFGTLSRVSSEACYLFSFSLILKQAIPTHGIKF